jgi:hypothetical protein
MGYAYAREVHAGSARMCKCGHAPYRAGYEYFDNATAAAVEATDGCFDESRADVLAYFGTLVSPPHPCPRSSFSDVDYSATVCAIIRLECVVKILPNSLGNPTYSLWQALLFQFTEVPVGIICICVPTFRPVARAISQSKYGSYVVSLVSTWSASVTRLYGQSKGSSKGSGTNNSKPSSSHAERDRSLQEDERWLKENVEVEMQCVGKPNYENLPDFPEMHNTEHK